MIDREKTMRVAYKWKRRLEKQASYRAGLDAFRTSKYDQKVAASKGQEAG